MRDIWGIPQKEAEPLNHPHYRGNAESYHTLNINELLLISRLEVLNYLN